MFYKKSALRNFVKFPGKYLYQSLFFNKETKACNFIKKDSGLLNFTKYLRAPFLQNTSGRLFLEFRRIKNPTICIHIILGTFYFVNCFSSQNLSVYSVYHFHFSFCELSNFHNRILTNQKPE